MDSILETLETADPKTLTPQFVSFLSTFSDFIPLDPKPKNPRKKKRSQITPTSVRPLAKQFLPFLSKSLNLIPALLRRNPSSPSPIDGQRATELLKIYRLVLDCFSCISPCLVGNPNFVDIEMGGLVYCLESWGKYEEAEEEGVLLMGRLEIGKRERLEPEIVMVAIKVVACLLGCAYKQKSKDGEVYRRNLQFLEQVSPCIRVLDTESMGKYHTLLVNALFRSALFLAGECISFDSGLVREFCEKTLIECLKSSSIDRFHNISRNICKSIDQSWEGRPSLILDVLNITLKGSLCECKVGIVKSVNEFLEFVAYCVKSLCLTSIDICEGASELLYKYGGDFFQVSPPLASILLLYATGLYVKSSNAKVSDASPLLLFLGNEQKLQRLSHALDALAKYFKISIDSNKIFFKSEVRESDLPFGVLESMENKASKHLHGNVSMLSYLDALEYLCFLLVEYVNTTWEYLASQDRAAKHSLNISYIQDALYQFCDFILVAFKCSGTSERDIERLHESRKTLLQVAISVLKISLRVSENHKKSLSSFKSIISSSWIEPQELKYFISALGNIGASLYNTGQLKQASVALQLRCKTIWTHVKLLCKMYTENPQGRINDGLSEKEIKSVIMDAFEKCASIVDVLHKCRAANAHKIVVKSLIELSAGEDMFANLSGSLVLAKQWVKMLCKDFEDVDVMEKAPYLYSFLLSCNSTWSKKTLGRILEQELLAYELMEGRNPGLCQKMQLKVIDTLLDDIFTSEECHLQRSKILVRKGRALRARGKEGLNECIKCLCDAISLLKDTSGNPSTNNVPIYNQLALIYILAAQCTQEANQDCEVILQNVRNALEIWSSIDFQGLSSENSHMELNATNTVQLLCCIVDLLSMMGCWELQFGICKLIIMFLKCENVPTGKCLAMLWSERRINHSLCTSPINDDAILHMSQHLDNHADSVEFWITCLKEYPSSLVAFFQKLSLSDSILPEISLYRSEKYFGTASIDEVKKVASALISDVPLSSQSASIAGYLYYDLSERLLSGGRLFDALSHARVALWLRRKMLQRKFIYSFEQNFAEPGADANQNRQDNSGLEIIGSVATELWPDIGRSGDMDNSIITPWSVLRCYLESILQVGIINESIGNGVEAEVLFLTGKRISLLQNLPIFQIAFTSLLGQLYCKNQFWDLAEDELNNARNLLLEDDMIISCKRCKLAFDVFIDMQFGDLSRDRPEKYSPETFSSDALQVYRKALDKLSHNKLESSLNPCSMTDIVSTLLDKNNMQGAQHEVLSTGRRFSTSSDIRPLACSICSSLNRNVHHVKQVYLENMEGKESNLHKVIKKGSRISSKCLQKEHDLNVELKPKTCLSKRTSRNKSSSATDRVDNNEAVCADVDICSDILSLRKSRVKVNGNSSSGVGCEEECRSTNLKCWRCLLIKAMVEGNMRNIIHLKWENHCRRLVLRLLLKIAKYEGGCCRKNKSHEVHDEFWQYISVMFNQYPISSSSSDFSESCLIELTQGEDLRDIFPLERAAILYNLSRFILKDCYSEHSRMKCCTLANIQMPDVVPWLLRAFILSRELPLLFQKVSKLLACIMLISTVDGGVSVPFSTDGLLSRSHWAAYFHQASLGTYLPCQYLACFKDKACYPKVSEDPCAVMLDTVIKASNFLRFAPERVEHLEEFVREFFQSLPSVPIICISLLEGDYADLIGETLLLPSFLPAWMLLSRLKAGSQAIAMLLPVDRISEDVQFESMKEWQCPWTYSVVDYVAPVFKQLLKENFLSSNMTYTNADTKINNINWWSQRSNINNMLNNFLKTMEDSWLGPWTCLLLGEHSDLDYLSKVVTKLIKEMKLHCKVDANDTLVSVILGGSKSTADVEACISQLLLYNGYFGRGGCCGEERLRAFSSGCLKEKRSMPESVYKLILEATAEIAEQADREPVILVLDSDVQMLPWESLPALRKQEVYRMPSVGSISLTLRRCSYYQKQNKAFGAGFPLVNPLDSYYLLNPSGDLDSTQVEFEQWFRNQNWEGEAGKVPTAEELVLALRNHDFFLYFGHGSGMQYIPGKEIQKLEKCAAMLLMGCSSGSLTYNGSYAPRGAPLSYLFAGSPAVIANLWEVTDKDIDRFGKAILKSWLQEEPLSALENCTRCNQLMKEFGCLEIDEGKVTIPKSRRKAVKNKRLQHYADKGSCKTCGAKRIASFMSEARDACKFPFLIGASPVCYGVPTVIMKKS